MTNTTLAQRSRSSAGRWLGLLLIFGVCFVCGLSRVNAQTADEVTAAFLFNFAKYVEWPSNALPKSTAPIIVGFVGKNSLADMLEKHAKGRNANGRELVIKRLQGATGAEDCQIIYIADASQISVVLGALKSKPVLTVGEGEEFLTAGGMIAFRRDGARLVFDLNADVINACQLHPNAKLVQVAHSVKRG